MRHTSSLPAGGVIRSRYHPAMTWIRRSSSWLAVLALTVALTATTTHQSLRRYEDFRSGFSWDLAYYNQWFWAMTRGDGLLTVRPLSAYAEEGPSVWKTNYLAPIRFAVVPLYALWPDPRTLLVIQNIVFWWVLPASYMLVRAESKSEWLALSAAAMVPLTPLMWPLVWNDFRELQLAFPFVIWAIQGWRERKGGLAATGIAGMLACRQEFALIVLSLSIMPPINPETPRRRRVWTRSAVIIGLGWMLFVFLPYLAWRVGPHAPADYLTQVAGSSQPMGNTLRAALDCLFVGLGSWVVFALFAPRVALAALPWVWNLANGQWALWMLETVHWHHVRYAAPLVALLLAAGLGGYARAATLLARRFPTRSAQAGLWALALLGLVMGNVELQSRFARVPQPISISEADRLWSWIRQVGPDHGVLAAYEVAAPLSSRRWLYSYRLDENKPPGYPRLAPGIHWAFVRTGEFRTEFLAVQGFVEVSAGPAIKIFRRATVMVPP